MKEQPKICLYHSTELHQVHQETSVQPNQTTVSFYPDSLSLFYLYISLSYPIRSKGFIHHSYSVESCILNIISISPLNSKFIYPNIKLKHLHHCHPGNSKLLFCFVSQSCLTLLQLIDGSPPGSSVHGISQARILEWVAISFSKGSS